MSIVIIKLNISLFVIFLLLGFSNAKVLETYLEFQGRNYTVQIDLKIKNSSSPVPILVKSSTEKINLETSEDKIVNKTSSSEFEVQELQHDNEGLITEEEYHESVALELKAKVTKLEDEMACDLLYTGMLRRVYIIEKKK
ncbi:hypothetical protein WA026_023390 [Henosepilachna vigintioctopunctata]|uniref:Uncharacterized protein n=1 Tax=Henosepilachna vigintioctopunctata TaxID=420089 RepID=A0AAW1UMW8_9CUCU